MKKASVLIIAVILVILLSGCGGKMNGSEAGKDRINVISREAGSGTRDAFIEMTGIRQQGKDNTTLLSEITSSTFVVLMSVAGDRNAIGYVSMEAMSDIVKGVKIDGVAPVAENVRNGSYPLARDFALIYNGQNNPLAEDFMAFVTGSEGSRIIEEQGYVPVEVKPASPKGISGEAKEGRIVITGSTSVAPLIDVMADNYRKIHPKVEIEIQQTGSGAGIMSVIEGAADIGISSRPLSADEKKKGIFEINFARDGIGVIVHPDNPIDNLSVEEIRKIFTGERDGWEDL